ncbi:MAG: PrsW family intramembrane metalloprotease [Oscillospiraceae bacterium]|nr:PrsW family intramembrane metalloprotease [Oscillospiraceae bacterium]
MKYCPRCGARLSDEVVFCVVCGLQQNVRRNYGYPQNGSRNPGHNPYPPNYQPGYPPNYPPRHRESGIRAFFDRLTGAVNNFAGGYGAVRPPLRAMFSQTFAPHSQEEAEALFICGTPMTTPRLSSQDTLWPKPWLYARVLMAFAVAFLMMHFCCVTFGNLNCYPGTILLGSFMVPVAVLIFFFELNTPKNISFYTVLKIFLVGGCASLLLTLFLYTLFPFSADGYTEAVVIGIIEELGKLGVVAVFLHREKDARYNINGLLVGAAVGAGFAAFESAGYAFNYLLANGYSGMLRVIFLRAILAPGGHVVWAAMSGYAIMLVKKQSGPSVLGFLGQSRFWQIFWMPVAIHAVWDMPIPIGAEFALVQILMVIMSWVVIFVFINNSLGQLSRYLRNETVLHR